MKRTLVRLVTVLAVAACGPSITPSPSVFATPSNAPVSAAPSTAPGPTTSAYGPATTPTAACVAEDGAGAIPAIELVTPDGRHLVGEPYASRWAGAAVGPAGGPIPSAPVLIAAGQPLQIVVAGNVCAIDWYIAYGGLPPADGAPWKFTPLGELVPTVAQNRDPAYAAQNQFALAPLPTGNWVLAVTLDFLQGEELVWWRVSVA